jgi:dienelactone hydrolase
VVGFCFGGGLVWQLLASGALGVSAAAPFYGPLPPDPTTPSSTTPVRDATPPRRPTRGSGCWTGSAATSAVAAGS